jgi:hypothetical protein
MPGSPCCHYCDNPYLDSILFWQSKYSFIDSYALKNGMVLLLEQLLVVLLE